MGVADVHGRMATGDDGVRLVLAVGQFADEAPARCRIDENAVSHACPGDEAATVAEAVVVGLVKGMKARQTRNR